ncbi:MAG: hypothetical protein M3Z96_14745 [Pseudomonadota bacterium]|nr:hypothetical protein [Pseudomonadota bacterium]
MVDYESDDDGPKASRFSLRSLFIRDWPYILMLLLAIFGVAYASTAAPQAMTSYWTILCPIFAIICVATQWRDVEGPVAHWHLIWTQAFHWFAVILAMFLVLLVNVKRMMNADANALVILTLLALGTVTAGIRHVSGWRVCLVGVVLGLGVPAIAWLERSTLLLLLIATVLVAIAVLYVMYTRRERGY